MRHQQITPNYDLMSLQICSICYLFKNINSFLSTEISFKKKDHDVKKC